MQIIYSVVSLIVGIFIIVKPFTPRNRLYFSSWALVSSSFAFFFVLWVWLLFDGSYCELQFLTHWGRIPVGIDGISLYFLLLTTFLFPICILISWGFIHTRKFLACLLSVELFLIITFVVVDVLWFYIFFEAVLIPIYLLIGIWGSRTKKIKASYFFFIYTLLGSLFMLCGILYIYSKLGTTLHSVVVIHTFSLKEEQFLWLSFFLSFAVKIPIVPFHIWLPEAHVEAPTIGSAILAGVLLKLGVYGFIRYSIPIFPNASIYFIPIVITICIISICYASLTAIRQTDLKRIIAYTSIAHINLVVIGIFSFNVPGINGSIIQSLSHGFVSTALFILIGVLYDRYHSRLYLHYSGLTNVIPLFSIFFLLNTLGNIGIPGTGNFTGEFILLNSVFAVSPIAAIIAATSLIWSTVYSLWLLNRLIYGNLKIQYISTFTDLNKIEIFGLLLLGFIIVIIGLFPDVFFKDIFATLNWWVLNVR
jgi:proton-translocating NADH-quinone oxidoreductase chain M